MTEFKINDLITVKIEPTDRYGYGEPHIYVNGKPFSQYDPFKLEPIISDLLNGLEKIPEEWRYRVFNDIFHVLKGTNLRENLMREKFSEFINWIEDIQDKDKQYLPFRILLQAIKDTDIIDNEFSNIDKKFNEIVIEYHKKNEFRLEAWPCIIDLIDGTELLDKYYSFFEAKLIEKSKEILDELDNMPMIHIKIVNFYRFLEIIKNTKVIKTLYPTIENKFTAFLSTIYNLNPYDQHEFKVLFDVAKGTGLIERKFIHLLMVISRLEGRFKDDMFSMLFNYTINNDELLTQKFVELLNEFDKFDPNLKFELFKNLLGGIKKKKPLMMIQNYQLIEKKFDEFLVMIETSVINIKGVKKINNFRSLVYTIRGTELMQTKFLELMKGINKFQGIDKFYAFIEIFDGIKRTQVLNQYFTLIETKFIELIEGVNISNDNEFKNLAFWVLISSVRGTKLVKNNIPLLSKIYKALPVGKKNQIKKAFPKFSRLMK
ncbi:MAG: hypothetical protein JSV62_12350 [Promethearchaeota archaeon]|nr:MAG: hypothetical protein JSV62_12350 [Candidatus Lokiarchaeota archaeon]